VLYFAGRDPLPSAHGSRFIQLAGQGVLIADYPDLVGVTYCGDAENATAAAFYKTDNPAVVPHNRTTVGTYMILPDCRGKFLRSLNGTAAIPIDIDRNLNVPSLNDEPGSAQLSQAGSHDHNVGWDNGGTIQALNWSLADSYWVNTTSGAGLVEIDILTRGGAAIVNGGAEGFAKTTDGGYDYAVPTDTETRPLNIAFYAMIRY